MVYKNCFLLCLPLLANILLFGQETHIHSHNDYLQKAPFWTAYANGLASIEVDVHLKDTTLYVAHDATEIRKAHTLQSLYLDP